MLLPTNVSTGQVKGQFIVGLVDGADGFIDGNTEPDVIPAAGFVTFTASVPYLPDPTASPNPVTILQTSVVAVLDSEGYLCTPAPGTLEPSYRFVRLIATDDPDLSVTGWTWTATYAFTTMSGQKLAIPSHSFAVPSGGAVDLASVVKIPSSTGIGTEQAEALAASAQAAAVSAAAAAAASAAAAELAAEAAQVTDAGISTLIAGAGTATQEAVTDLVTASNSAKLDTDDAVGIYQSQASLDAAAAAKASSNGTALNNAVKAVANAAAATASGPKLDAATAAATYAVKSVETSKLDASQKGAASGVAPLGSDSKVPDANLPQRLQDADLNTKIDGRVTPAVNTAVPPAVSSYIANDPSVVSSAATAAQNTAGIILPVKANTSYAAGQRAVTPSGDYASAKIAFTTGAGGYVATNWNPSDLTARQDGRVLAAGTDFHAVAEEGWHKILDFPGAGVNAPWTGVRGEMHVSAMSATNRILKFWSYETTPRLAEKTCVSGVWGSWREIGPASLDTRLTALESKPNTVSPVSGLKVVPLQLTLGSATQADAALTGTRRYLMKWNAPIQRVRVNIQNVHPSSGTLRTGAVDFTGLWVGKHASNGAFTAAPTQVATAFSTPADGSKWVSKWFNLDQTPGVEDLLSFGYTASNGTVFQIGGSGWKTDAPADASATNPAGMTADGSMPFYIWLEAETYATTPHIAVFGDSLSSGVSAGGVNYSMLSQYCWGKKALPTHYSNSGDTMQSWAGDLNSFKWKVFDGLAKPDALIWAMGSNDLFADPITLAQAQGYFNTLYPQMLSRVSQNIYLANITPRTAVTGANEVKRRDYNTWLTGLPNGARDLFNFRDAVSADDETLMPAYDADGVHMNAAGYAAEAATITRPVTTPPVMYQAL